MKHSKLVLILMSFIVTNIQCGYSQKPQSQKEVGGDKNGFAVIELFTSEGCSSCPSADELMPVLQKEYGAKVYVLEFHVDYWNRLGWADVFSKSAFTKRQNEYANALSSSNTYTPQAVVNGKVHITGSNKTGLKKLIDAELKITQREAFSLNASQENKKMFVTYKTKLEKNSVVNIALVQLHATTKVKAGENGGRKLQHTNVVMDFATFSIGEGKVALSLPEDARAQNFHIIAFVQNEKMHITSVQEVEIK